MEVFAAVVAGVFSLLAIRYKHHLENHKKDNTHAKFYSPFKANENLTQESFFKKLIKFLALTLVNYISVGLVLDAGYRYTGLLLLICLFWVFLYLVLIVKGWKNITNRRLGVYIFLLLFNLIICISAAS